MGSLPSEVASVTFVANPKIAFVFVKFCLTCKFFIVVCSIAVTYIHRKVYDYAFIKCLFLFIILALSRTEVGGCAVVCSQSSYCFAVLMGDSSDFEQVSGMRECELCSIQFNSITQAVVHMASARHEQAVCHLDTDSEHPEAVERAQELMRAAAIVELSLASKHGYYCRACEVWCNMRYQMMAHEQSKHHIEQTYRQFAVDSSAHEKQVREATSKENKILWIF